MVILVSRQIISLTPCDELYIHLSMFFSVMVVYSIVFEDLLVSSMVPIPKAKQSCQQY